MLLNKISKYRLNDGYRIILMGELFDGLIFSREKGIVLSCLFGQKTFSGMGERRVPLRRGVMLQGVRFASHGTTPLLCNHTFL